VKEAWVPFSRICAAAAGLTLVITIVAIGITAANRSLNREVVARQELINQAVASSQISTRLANSLVAVTERDNDARIRAMLEEHGITVRPRSAPEAPPAPAKAK
jgi:hypothetical protein